MALESWRLPQCFPFVFSGPMSDDRSLYAVLVRMSPRFFGMVASEVDNSPLQLRPKLGVVVGEVQVIKNREARCSGGGGHRGRSLCECDGRSRSPRGSFNIQFNN